jgi:hypothetical protein
MYTPLNRDLDALCQYVPFLPGGCEDTASENAQGRYLCEGCQDVMTDSVLSAGECILGVEMACCLACALRLRRP